MVMLWLGGSSYFSLEVFLVDTLISIAHSLLLHLSSINPNQIHPAPLCTTPWTRSTLWASKLQPGTTKCLMVLLQALRLIQKVFWHIINNPISDFSYAIQFPNIQLSMDLLLTSPSIPVRQFMVSTLSACQWMPLWWVIWLQNFCPSSLLSLPLISTTLIQSIAWWLLVKLLPPTILISLPTGIIPSMALNSNSSIKMELSMLVFLKMVWITCFNHLCLLKLGVDPSKLPGVELHTQLEMLWP